MANVIDLTNPNNVTTIVQNRQRKTYSVLRNRPQNLLLLQESTQTFIAETGTLTFTNSESNIYYFTGSFTSAPTVILTPVDSLGNSQANINVFVSNVTTTSMEVSSSAVFTGNVNFQIIQLVTS